MQPQEICDILEAHLAWLHSKGKEGDRAIFDGADLRGADLRKAVLEEAEFKNTDLTGTNLQDAQLQRASFDGVSMQHANLSSADLSEAKFQTCDLTSTNFRGASLPSSTFNGTSLQGADLRDAILDGAEFRNTDLTDTKLEDAGLREARFDNANFRRTNFRNAFLSEAQFKDAALTETNLQGATLWRANFEGAILAGTNLREADLQTANLESSNFLLTSQLAGANVAGAKLPRAIGEFRGLETIAEATSNAQKLFIAMLGGCVYSWLTIGTTKDAALLTNSASSPLPIIGTALPIVGFYMVAPVVLLAMYFYFHLNMQRLWEALADLPAVFPDGRGLDKRADPWLLNGLVSAHFARLVRDRPALSRVQQWLSILLAWWVVPVTLFVFWGRFLPRHDWSGSSLHIWLLALAIGFAWMSYRLARATLRGVPRISFRWAQAWTDVRTYKRIGGVFVMVVVAIILYVTSFGAIEGIPSTTANANRQPYRLHVIVPRMLGHIGFSAFANLVEEDVSTKPANWTGKTEEYPLVRGARLRSANMQYANAASAFLANADMSGANLRDADLSAADLTNANLDSVILDGSDLNRANLSGADLTGADLSAANLGGANLSGVDLSRVKGLTWSEVKRAVTDEKTLLPANLPP